MAQELYQDIPTRNNTDTLKQPILANLYHAQGKVPEQLTIYVFSYAMPLLNFIKDTSIYV